MRLSFTKMHGLGNDFVVIDGVRQPVALTTEQIRLLADRRRGVGCDQVLVAEAANDAGFDFRYRIFNADGGEVEQCGNGARCFARFVHEQGLSRSRQLRVQTLGGAMSLELQADGQVRVEMGVPRFAPAEVPFQAAEESNVYALDVAGQRWDIGVVSIGNPHAVLVVEDVERAPVQELGAAIERHPRFPARVNVGFMQILAANHIRLRVFERGAGETQACGSGACAAVIVGRRRGLLEAAARVDLPGGELMVSWAGDSKPVYLTGPATTVFEGTIEL